MSLGQVFFIPPFLHDMDKRLVRCVHEGETFHFGNWRSLRVFCKSKIAEAGGLDLLCLMIKISRKSFLISFRQGREKKIK